MPPRCARPACVVLLAALVFGPATLVSAFQGGAERPSVTPASDAPQKLTRPAYSPTPVKKAPTPEQPSPFFDMLGEPFKGRRLSRPSAPTLGLAASSGVVELCGGPGAARVQLTASGFDPEGRQLRYRWAVTGGRVGGDAHEVFWDLTAVPAGTYTARVYLESYGGGGALASREAKVRVRECRRTTGPQPPVCPSISLCCPASVTEGRPAEFVATLYGGTPGVSRSVWWTVSGGNIVKGGGTEAIEVDTAGLGGRRLRAHVEAGGYGLKCSSACETLVALAPLPPPTPTPPDTSTVSTRPAPQPTPQPTPQPSPEPTPTPSPSPSPTTEAAPPPEAETRITPAEVHELGAFLKYALWLLLLSGLGTAAYMRLRSKPGGGAEQAPGPEPVPSTPVPSAPVPPAPVPSAPDVPAPAGAGAASDEVYCTVYAPPEAPPGDTFLVQVFAHLAEQAELLAQAAAGRDDSAVEGGCEVLDSPVERGKRLTFVLDMPGLTVDRAERSLVWNGRPDCARFRVTIPDDFKPKTIWGAVEVLCDCVPIGEVAFKFKVAERAPQPAPAPAPGGLEQEFIRFRKAFISYSHVDMPEVLERVQMLEAENIQCFMDKLTLREGEDWKEMLYHYIDQSDVFYLFWSSAAKNSEEVRKEWEYAWNLRMERGRPSFKPVPVEGPPVVEPPPTLSHLHFDSRFRYFIRGAEATAQAAHPAHTEPAGSRPSAG